MRTCSPTATVTSRPDCSTIQTDQVFGAPDEIDEGTESWTAGPLSRVSAGFAGTGSCSSLSATAARLRRSAHRVVWLNPLASHPDFEPLSRGMRAEVPHTDELLAGNSLASLEELAAILEEI